MHVAQVSFHADPLAREPDALLEAWPTLPAVATATVNAGVEVTVVQAAAHDAVCERQGVRYVFVREPRPTRVHGRLGLWASPGGDRVARRVAEVGADVLHVQGLGFPRHLARLASVNGSAPIVAQDHADRPPPRWAARFWRRALDRAAGVVFTAKEQALPFVAAGALGPTTPVYEVLESSSTFTPGNRGEARRSTGLHGDPCCIWLARLDANKDPLTALAAFERVLHALADARLWMFWRQGPLESAVRDRVANSAILRERVHLGGALARPDVERALRAADFLIQSSHREGSGYAIIEALACGATPIVTDIPSLHRITRGGQVGALYPPGDAAVMADALVRLAQSDRAELRTAARHHFEAHLGFDTVGRELTNVYRAVLR